MALLPKAVFAANLLDAGGQVFNVRNPAYGAVGDGVADDGPAWNLARADLNAAGGVVMVPQGAYLLTTAFTFASATNVLVVLQPGAVLTGSALPTPTGTNAILDLRAGVLTFGDGALGAPTFSFTSDPDTGMYRSAANQVTLVAGGAQVLRLSVNVVDVVAGGTEAAPSLTFVADVDTGVFHPAANAVALSAGGSERLRAFDDVRIGDGTAIATTATTGFLLIPGCAGTPTGNPTNDGVGAVALVYDTTNNLLYANDGGGWVAVNSP